MNSSKEITTIEEVIVLLEEIIQESEKHSSTMGYFAVLYQKVTIKVKEGIADNFFDDGKRMEKLDIVFAKRYLDAYNNWQANREITQSWKRAFEMISNNRLIVLQHLLLGMNAHINLDLGIAAAEVSKNTNIHDLEDDFMKINDILSSIVNDVQNDLSKIWPMLKRILRWTKKVDDFLIDFSMELARDGAWEFAKKLSSTSIVKENSDTLIKARDIKVAQKSAVITKPGKIASLILRIIRFGEKGSVSDRIKILK